MCHNLQQAVQLILVCPLAVLWSGWAHVIYEYICTGACRTAATCADMFFENIVGLVNERNICMGGTCLCIASFDA